MNPFLTTVDVLEMNETNSDPAHGESLPIEFDKMSLDDLWFLREQITKALENRIIEEKRKLEGRLALLTGAAAPTEKQPRPYPKVLPKYRNPEQPTETWSGRGRKPTWVVGQLKSGKRLQDLAI